MASKRTPSIQPRRNRSCLVSRPSTLRKRLRCEQTSPQRDCRRGLVRRPGKNGVLAPGIHITQPVCGLTEALLLSGE